MTSTPGAYSFEASGLGIVQVCTCTQACNLGKNGPPCDHNLVHHEYLVSKLVSLHMTSTRCLRTAEACAPAVECSTSQESVYTS